MCDCSDLSKEMDEFSREASEKLLHLSGELDQLSKQMQSDTDKLDEMIGKADEINRILRK